MLVAVAAAGCSAPSGSPLPREGSLAREGRRAVVKLAPGAEAPVELAALGATVGLGLRPATRLALAERAGQRSGLTQPSLDTVHSLAVPPAWSQADAAGWAQGLREDPGVEWVVLRQLPVPAPADLDPPTPALDELQGYLDPGVGIDARGAWALGFRGAGVRLRDVEYGWNAAHEDLEDVPLNPESGQTVAPEAIERGLAPQHGTAALGMIVAPHNGYGVDGLAPDVEAFTYPEWTVEGGLRRAEAVAAAVADSAPGDVLMLEMQTPEPGTNALGPAELDADVWMLTRMAVDAGVVVVAAAGNGALDLDGVDATEYRGRGDSGAILVGAGAAGTREALSFATHGSRVDLQGWGASVFTLGYGDHATYGDDDNQAYTETFEGSSAALPMVAAATALLLEASVGDLSPAEVRGLLVATGAPQAEGPHVGPLPDVTAALAWVGARERTPPELSWVAPEGSAVVLTDFGAPATVEVDVQVADASPIYRVSLDVDGEVVRIDGVPSAITLSLEEGVHELRVGAEDVWGNEGWAEVRTVEVAVEEKGVNTETGAVQGSSGGAEPGMQTDPSAGTGSGGCAAAPRSGREGGGRMLLLLAVAGRRRRLSKCLASSAP